MSIKGSKNEVKLDKLEVTFTLRLRKYEFYITNSGIQTGRHKHTLATSTRTHSVNHKMNDGFRNLTHCPLVDDSHVTVDQITNDLYFLLGVPVH